MTTQQILNTLSYFSAFNFPLTKDELWRYLFGAVPFDQFDRGLSDLLSTKAIQMDGVYYKLFGSVNLVNRQEREKISLQKIDMALRIFKTISWWPWLRGVLVTGSTAAMNAAEDSDIDVLIITSKDALWLTRPVVVIYLKLVGVYRNVICPNIWITEDSLEWGRQDLPTAVDAVLTKPIVDKNKIYDKFLSNNTWIKSYLPNIEIPNSLAPVGARFIAPLKFIDKIFFKVQLFFMKSKVTSEEVTLSKAHFKKVDNHQKLIFPISDTSS